jgi:hypothetical protein
MEIRMPNDPRGQYFSREILNGLIARIGLSAYGVLSVIAAAESQSEGPVRMSLEKIAEKIGKSVETTRLALDILKQQDLLTVEMHGRNNVYRVAHNSRY